METEGIVEGALKLKPDLEIDRVWIDEAERRLAAYRAGQVEGILAEEIFGKS